MTHEEIVPANDYQHAFDLLWDALREKNRQIERMYEQMLSKDILIHSLSTDIDYLKNLLAPTVKDSQPDGSLSDYEDIRLLFRWY